MRDSGLFERPETYEIEVEFENDMCSSLNAQDMNRYMRLAIKTISSGIQYTAYPVSLPQQFSVLKNYMNLIKNTQYAEGDYAPPRSFISPSMSSLQMRNVINNPDYIATNPSILKGYCATEKADGLHKLLFFEPAPANLKDPNTSKSVSLRLFTIDMNMNVQFTGLVTKNLRLANTLLDGEHVLHGKRNKYINRFLVFDVFYVNGIDIREYPLIRKDGEVNGSAALFESLINKNVSKQETIIEPTDERSRYFYMKKIMMPNNLKVESIVPDGQISFQLQLKNYVVPLKGQNIFDCTASVLESIKSTDYNTDGIIYTPIHLGVGADNVGEKIKHNTKRSWEHLLKWKPIEDLTIDFLVTTKKDNAGTDVIYTRFLEGNDVNVSNDKKYIRYKCLELRVGYNEKFDGYLNPYEDMLNDVGFSVDANNLYDTEVGGGFNTGNDGYKPALFYPDSPLDANAHICNVLLQKDENGTEHMRSEEGDIVEDMTIIECRYNKDNEHGWKWEILRVRYDKTAELRNGGKQYGNAYKTANSNWHIIHNPITTAMITTGQGIPTVLDDMDNVYYANVQTVTHTTGLQHFHNRYVKSELITKVTKPGVTLIDFGVGRAGDLSKWQHNKLSFVFGMDVNSDGIKNRWKGACTRYLNDLKKSRAASQQYRDTALQCIFIPGDVGRNIKSGDAADDDETKRIIECVFGIQKHEGTLGAGVTKHFGKLVNGADVGSIQFAIHYMFESKEKLYTFVQNAAECIKVGGYFIGTCFDGRRIFELLREVKTDQSYVLHRNGNKMWQLTKKYSDRLQEMPDGEASLGMAIEVFHDTIGQTISEYLVNFDYLTEVMEAHGFVPMPQDELESGTMFPQAIGNFQLLFDQMVNRVRGQAGRSRNRMNYGDALSMSEEEKTISFCNNYFVFKKTQALSVKSLSASAALDARSKAESEAVSTSPSSSDVTTSVESTSSSGTTSGGFSKDKIPSVKIPRRRKPRQSSTNANAMK